MTLARRQAANCLIALALAAATFAQSASPSLAEDMDEVMQVVKSGKCPESLDKYPKVKTADFCAYLNKGPCQNNDSDETCFLQLKDCWSRVNQLNKEIFTYNQFMRKCGVDRGAAKATAGAAVPTKIPAAANAKQPATKSKSAKAQKKSDDQGAPN
jgi:hypothetical protein